jgi:ectoine hydroxylase-related dioxygenase (phytanoyl-CoA dioxygenase family)
MIAIAAADSLNDVRRTYFRDGYAVLRALFSATAVAELRAETAAIGRGARGAVRGVRADARDLSDDEVCRRYLCIHHPHKLSAPMREALFHPRLLEALGEVIGPNVKCMQSMLFVKGPGKPGQAWHQDEFFIPTRDRSLCGVWIALDDATIENGCLWVIPGSHKPAVIYRTRPLSDPRFDGSPVATDFPFDEGAAVPLTAMAGDVVVFHGYLLHQSLPNSTADQYRRALVFHCMSAESLLPWDDEGRLPRTDDMRDVLLVRGTDPHAYKGTATVLEPYLREAG